MSPPNNEHMLELWRQRSDLRIQAELAKVFRTPMQKIARRYARLYKLDSGGVDDLTTEAFFGLLKGLNDYQEGGMSFYHYICKRITWHIAGYVKENYGPVRIPRSAYAAGTRVFPVFLDAPLEEGEKPVQVADDAPEAVDVLTDLRTIETLRHAFDKLRGRPRDVIELELSGMNQADIAQKLGCARQNVNQARERALKVLRKHLREWD